MTKLFELIGTIIATACLIELASNPAGALRDIHRGPMPDLAGFNRKLSGPSLETKKAKPRLGKPHLRDE